MVTINAVKRKALYIYGFCCRTSSAETKFCVDVGDMLCPVATNQPELCSDYGAIFIYGVNPVKLDNSKQTFIHRSRACSIFARLRKNTSMLGSIPVSWLDVLQCYQQEWKGTLVWPRCILVQSISFFHVAQKKRLSLALNIHVVKRNDAIRPRFWSQTIWALILSIIQVHQSKQLSMLLWNRAEVKKSFMWICTLMELDTWGIHPCC